MIKLKIMKVIKIRTRYISEDTNFRLPRRCVLNKVLPGCGLTSYVLNLPENLILAEPTIALVDNKLSQGISGKKLLRYTDPKVLSGKATQGIKEGCCKILTTFDSIPKLESYLQKGWWIVIDEFQNLLTRYLLKSGIYLKVLDLLERYKDQVVFVSATPIPTQYEPDWLKSLDHYTLEFNPEFRTTVQPILLKALDPAERFRRDVLEPILEKDSVTLGTTRFSKCIVFVNSLRGIERMVKNLDRTRFAVMCADGHETFLRKRNIPRFVQDKKSIRKLPDFLFVTGVGFEGLDLYSKDHVNVVVSFRKNEDLFSLISMDIDLPQILGRNRDLDNPHRGKFVFIYQESVIDGDFKIIEEDLAQARLDLSKHKSEIRSRNLVTSGKFFDCIELFREVEPGVFVENEIGINYREYILREILKRYLKGGVEILINSKRESFKQPILVPDLSWEGMVAKFKRIISGGMTASEQYLLQTTGSAWTAYEQDSVYFKTLQRLQQEGKPLPEKLPSKEIRRTVKKAKSDYYPQVARELKSTIALGGRYTNSELRAKIYDAYQKFGINKKVYGATIQVYAEVTRQSAYLDGKSVLLFKVKSWKS